MAAPDIIKELVERFDRNLESYKSGQYNETQVRREFIDPFFGILGWDMVNKDGNAEAYKDVIHEDAIKIGGETKAPDYCFRIGGTRKFFLEAKKPAINIKDDISPAFQLRRYAWSAKLPLSILTDFEEFAVYDTRFKPSMTDKPSTARVKYYNYKDYIQKWDEIEGIFSKDAIYKGSFDKYAVSNKTKKGTATVDDAFLDEIESYRLMLAKTIALRNPELTQRELNFAVQRTIDRIIFLRICEDRGSQSYGQLQALLNGGRVYQRLCDIFTWADERYNSGLFHFSVEKDRNETPDTLTRNLNIEDKPLKDIIRSLYYPDSPYEFSVLSADILGQVYEQFLGKVIRLTDGHRAIVEDKPEVKKAGGIYYTPTYIVDYIVQNTVGELVKEKTPKQVAKLKILDPACGSGSFLINAYQFLLDWHLDWYTKNNPDEWTRGKTPAILQTTSGSWKLTTHKRKEILINNIYGVDIDSQAVEVTKLSLLLKVLEGEDKQNIENILQLFHQRALPDLGHNIKCGNSLIGPDFYEVQEFLFIDDEEKYKINVFDWNTEFSEIMKFGGFDVVIGNPPYGYLIPSYEQEYFKYKYHFQDYQKDYYLLFLEKYHELLKNNGLLGVIVSNTWMLSVTFHEIRKYIVTSYLWLKILHLPEKVFKAVVDTHVLIFQKETDPKKQKYDLIIEEYKNHAIHLKNKIPFNKIPNNGDPINVVMSYDALILNEKIHRQCLVLKEIFNVYNGVKPFEVGKGKPPQTLDILENKPYVFEGLKSNRKWSPLLRGSLIQRYKNLWDNNYWILYGPWLAAPRDPLIFEAPIKIVIRQTGDSIIATIIKDGFIARDNLHILLPKDLRYDLHYVLGVMNSKVIDFLYTVMNPEKGEALAQVKKHHIENLLIKPIDFTDAKDKSIYEQIIKMVHMMLELNKQLPIAKTPHEKDSIQRQITATDIQIDQLVCELYGLTEEEIRIVQGER